MMPGRCAISLATVTLSLSAASPAMAISADAYTSIVVFDPTALRTVDASEPVPGGSVVLSLDPRGLSATASVEGSGQDEQVVTATGTITNISDEAVAGVGALDFTVDLSAEFDAADERAEAGFFAELLFGDDAAGAINKGFNLSPSCSEFPCSDWIFDSSTDYAAFTIGAKETLPVLVIASATVSTVAPIPLPASLGPAALALGGLAWAGRRKLRG